MHRHPSEMAEPGGPPSHTHTHCPNICKGHFLRPIFVLHYRNVLATDALAFDWRANNLHLPSMVKVTTIANNRLHNLNESIDSHSGTCCQQWNQQCMIIQVPCRNLNRAACPFGLARHALRRLRRKDGRQCGCAGCPAHSTS